MMAWVAMRALKIGLVAGVAGVGAPGASAQTFHWVGTLEGYEVLNARAVSADGRVVVGYARSLATSGTRAFRWSADTGVQSLGVLPGGEAFTGSQASDVSDDGSVIVGQSYSTAGMRAFRWTAGGGLTDLGLPPGQLANASAGNPIVSGDGRVVVGSLNTPSGPVHYAFAWTAAGGAQYFNIARRSIPRVMTYDGSAVLGHAEITTDSYSAVRWDLAANQTVLLPNVWVSGMNIAATAMWVQRGFDWYFWTSTDGFEQLVDPASTYMYFGAVSADGRLFGGNDSDGAMVWRPGHGAMAAEDYLRRSGVAIPADAEGQLGLVVDVSADGRVLMGQGEIHPPGPLSYTGVWVAMLPRCGNADFNNDGDSGTDADIEAFFACLAGNCCVNCYPAGADFNGDGDVGTDQDIEAFFRVLGGGVC
jgi:probable HAF family extracellular repeat protein